MEADLIVLGPGSLFTSTIPPLLVPGLADAVRAQTGHEHIQQTALRATDDFAEGVKSVAERRSLRAKSRRRPSASPRVRSTFRSAT